MADVILYIDTIDGKPWSNDPNNPVRLSDPGPWLVVGRAIPANGYSIASLVWERDLMTPPIDIDRSNLPDWQFYLPKTFIQSTDTVESFWVTAQDNDTPPGFANQFAYVVLPAPVAPPVRPVQAKV